MNKPGQNTEPDAEKYTIQKPTAQHNKLVQSPYFPIQDTNRTIKMQEA